MAAQGFFAGFVAWWPDPIVMASAGVLVVGGRIDVGGRRRGRRGDGTRRLAA